MEKFRSLDNCFRCCRADERLTFLREKVEFAPERGISGEKIIKMRNRSMLIRFKRVEIKSTRSKILNLVDKVEKID